MYELVNKKDIFKKFDFVTGHHKSEEFNKAVYYSKCGISNFELTNFTTDDLSTLIYKSTNQPIKVFSEPIEPRDIDKKICDNSIFAVQIDESLINIYICYNNEYALLFSN